MWGAVGNSAVVRSMRTSPALGLPSWNEVLNARCTGSAGAKVRGAVRMTLCVQGQASKVCSGAGDIMALVRT